MLATQPLQPYHASMTTEEDGLKQLHELLTRISGGPEKVGTPEGRMAVAFAFGYFDARRMVFFMETYGLPLSLQAIKIVEWGLKVDFGGLRIELERIGKKPSTIESELKEVQYFVENKQAMIGAQTQ